MTTSRSQLLSFPTLSLLRHTDLLRTLALACLEPLAFGVISVRPLVTLDVAHDQLAVTAHAYHLFARYTIVHVAWQQAAMCTAVRSRPVALLFTAVAVLATLPREKKTTSENEIFPSRQQQKFQLVFQIAI